MSFSSTAIGTAISNLSITGVTVKDISAIPDSVNDRDCPILFPSPDGWISGGNTEPTDGPVTFGTATTRLWMFSRTYLYVYLHAPVGSGRGIKDFISAMSDKADAIQTAITTLNVSDVDVQSVSISEFGALQDPKGSTFFGFYVSVTCKEKLNNG